MLCRTVFSTHVFFFLCFCFDGLTNPEFFASQVAAADRVGAFKFGVEESSEKTTRFEESHAFHEEEASPPPPTLQTEMTTTHDDMSGGPCAPLLITVPSMGDWGKDGGTACFWSDINEDLEAAAAEAKQKRSITSVIMSEFDDFNFPTALIAEEEDNGMLETTFSHCAVVHVSDAGVEVAYEGGDEHDEELAGGGCIIFF